MSDDDEFWEQVGQDADKPRYTLCPTIVKTFESKVEDTRQCRFILSNIHTGLECGKCCSRVAVCDCERRTSNNDPCDRRFCPKLTE